MSQSSKKPQTKQLDSSPSLGWLVERAARSAIGEAKIRLEIDVPAGGPLPAAPQRLVELVTAMVRGSADAISHEGEITVTLWQTGNVCEIEVADDGPDCDSRPQRLPLVAAKLGAEMVWQNCPQGGAAVTAKLRTPLAIREAA